jgi:hypothetical protein
MYAHFYKLRDMWLRIVSNNWFVSLRMHVPSLEILDHFDLISYWRPIVKVVAKI